MACALECSCQIRNFGFCCLRRYFGELVWKRCCIGSFISMRMLTREMDFDISFGSYFLFTYCTGRYFKLFPTVICRAVDLKWYLSVRLRQILQRAQNLLIKYEVPSSFSWLCFNVCLFWDNCLGVRNSNKNHQSSCFLRIPI